jgi:ribosome assembly protein 4
MATIIPPPSKKARREEREKIAQASTSAAAHGPTAPNLVVSFSTALDDKSLGPAVRLPADTDKAGLELLANQLSKAQKKIQRRLDGEDDEDNDEDDDESTPFTFHVVLPGTDGQQRIPVNKDLWEVLKAHSQTLSVEDTIKVVCEPEAVFKVRLVTRCSSTLSGELVFARSAVHVLELFESFSDICRLRVI